MDVFTTLCYIIRFEFILVILTCEILTCEIFLGAWLASAELNVFAGAAAVVEIVYSADVHRVDVGHVWQFV